MKPGIRPRFFFVAWPGWVHAGPNSAMNCLCYRYLNYIQEVSVTMNFSLNFNEQNVSIVEDTWTALVTTGSDISLASMRAAILGVLERDGAFMVESSDGQVVRRIETPSEFEGYMQEVELQRTQYGQDQA